MRRSQLLAEGVDCGKDVTFRVERLCEVAVGAGRLNLQKKDVLQIQQMPVHVAVGRFSVSVTLGWLDGCSVSFLVQEQQVRTVVVWRMAGLEYNVADVSVVLRLIYFHVSAGWMKQ